MEILILSMEYTPEISGGVGTQVQELCRGLAQGGHHVVTIAYTLGPERILHEGQATIHLLSLSAAGAASPRGSVVESISRSNGALLERAERLVEQGLRPAIVQFSNWLTLEAALTLRQRLGCPIVSTVHFLSEPAERWWGQRPDPEIADQERLLSREADHFICVSRSMGALLQRTHGVKDNRLSVVHNCLDTASFLRAPLSESDRRQLRQKLGAGTRRIILFAGRLHPQKGIDALLEAAGRTFAERDDVMLLLVGEADSREFAQHIRGTIGESRPLTERTRMLGKVSRAQLSILYQVADIAVIPSVYEPFGYAALEAMASGVPTIASAVGGLAEIIENRRNGLLVSVRQEADRLHQVDVSALCTSFRLLLDDRAMADALGRAGRERVLANFAPETMVQATAAVYERVVASTSADRTLVPLRLG